MLAARLHQYDERVERDELLVLEDIPKPTIQSPDDVIVRIGGAGVCRTDLHIIEGIWRNKVEVTLPYILGHENAGWVEDIGDHVTTFKPGDAVVVHPVRTDGHCLSCRRGEDMHADESSFPGINANGGFAEYLLTSVRSLIKLPEILPPKDVAPYTDAGLTAYRAVKKAAHLLVPGDFAVIIGAGGLGHIGIQCLRSLCAARIIVVDKSQKALALAKELGANDLIEAGDKAVEEVLRLTHDKGAQAVIDFVGEGDSIEQGFAMTCNNGSYYVVGYGGVIKVNAIDLIFSEKNIIGNLVGNYAELHELMCLAEQGACRVETTDYPLKDANKALHDLHAGKLQGRAVLVP